MFAAATGLRPGEWIALEWRDLDLELDEPVVYVRRAFRNGRLKCPKTEGSIIRLLDVYGAEQRTRWTPVDARWTSKLGDRVIADNATATFAGR